METRTEYNPAKRIKAIKQLIQNSPNKVLTIEDFNQAIGTSSSIYYLNELRRKGHVIRYKTNSGFRGHQYTYEWIENPAPAIAKSAINNEVIESLEMLGADFMINHTVGEDAPVKNQGVIEFIKYLKSKHVSSV